MAVGSQVVSKLAFNDSSEKGCELVWLGVWFDSLLFALLDEQVLVVAFERAQDGFGHDVSPEAVLASWFGNALRVGFRSRCMCLYKLRG